MISRLEFLSPILATAAFVFAVHVSWRIMYGYWVWEYK